MLGRKAASRRDGYRGIAGCPAGSAVVGPGRLARARVEGVRIPHGAQQVFSRPPRRHDLGRRSVLLALVLGALTANTPGAAVACQGFPWCTAITEHGTPLWIQVTHRIIAFLLLGHLIGIGIGVRKRSEPGPIRNAAWAALGVVILQILVAAAMVEMHFPASLRSLHQAVGTALWIVVVALAALAAGPLTEGTSAIVRESPSRGEFATPEGVST
jgi:MFS family permease